MINVYVDGSCVNNGCENAQAGYGVFFKEGDERNEYNRVQGKQTNNTGELTGFIRALEILKDDIEKDKDIHIYTDSEYVMKCMKSYGDKLAKNDWKTSNGKLPPNRDLLKKAYGLYKPNEKYITLHHIKAHTNSSDEHSVGNSEADRLANKAIGLDRCPYANTKHFININYDSKDTAKSLGAKWDLREKRWYYEDDISDDAKRAINMLELAYTNSKDLVPIIEEKQEDVQRIYLNIPFKNKDAAKKLWARWDAERKSWYYLSTLDATRIQKLQALETNPKV